MLGLLGDKIDWPRKRRYDDAATVAAQQALRPRDVSTPASGAASPGRDGAPASSASSSRSVCWSRCALPYFDLNRAQAGVETLPPSDVKTAYELLEPRLLRRAGSRRSRSWSTATPAIRCGAGRRSTAARSDAGDGPDLRSRRAGRSRTEPATSPWSRSPLNGRRQLPERDSTRSTTCATSSIPAAFAAVPAEVYVTGGPAFNADFDRHRQTTTRRSSSPSCWGSASCC